MLLYIVQLYLLGIFIFERLDVWEVVVHVNVLGHKCSL